MAETQREGRGPSPEEEGLLRALGERVREARARHGMTRKALAADSGVSERYLAQLECGQGNVSMLLLRQIAGALNTPVAQLAAEGPEAAPELSLAIEALQALKPAELEEVRRWIGRSFARREGVARQDRIALIGLRGAGKSTLGARLAAHLDVPFIEVDKVVEEASGMPLAALFELYGQSGFRRLERQALQRAIDAHPRAVIAAGGGIVSDPATYERLLSQCFTVWLRAEPGDHMSRVIAQGDMRPMAQNREAMADLQRILQVRTPLYARADAQLMTSGRSPDETVEDALALLRTAEYAR